MGNYYNDYDGQRNPDIPVKRIGKGNTVAGFIMSLFCFTFFWVPIINLVLWIFSLTFTIIGLCRGERPLGLSVASLILNLLATAGIIILFATHCDSYFDYFWDIF